MNHYPRHIGDWMRDTAHLSELEELMYSRLIDQYYAREGPLPAELGQCCRLVRAANRAGRKAVQDVLDEFFGLMPDGYHQKRCDAEIARFTGRRELARQSAAVRWGSDRNANALPDGYANADAIASETHSVGNANQNQNQNHNQKAVKTVSRIHAKKNGAALLGSRLPADWQLPDDWRSWAVAYRPDLPGESIDREALVFRDYWHSKAGAQARKADWLATWRNWIRRKD